MDLKQFVKETLTQIIQGVSEAQGEASLSGGRVNPSFSGPGTDQHGCLIGFVEFDVAVSVSEGTGSKAGIGIFVGEVGLGAKGESTSASGSMSRIKFKVPVTLPRNRS